MIVPMKLWCLLLALATTEAMGEVDDDCMEFDGEVCLLQSSHFLRRSLGPWDEEGRGSAECPGSPVKVNAQPDKCSYEGVTITVPDGRSIEDFFDDNVEMKDFFYFVGSDRDVRIQPETHPFQLGESRLTVVGHDLAGNDRACHRTVIVSDAQRPAWTKDPTSVDNDITTYLDDACTKPASTVFSEYEKLGWVASGSDNCPTTGVQKQAKKGGDVLYDDSSADSVDTLTGPGTYEMVYTLTDGAGLSNRHTVVTHLKDNSPPTAMECPEDIFVEIEANETHGPVTWDLPKVTADNCLGVAEDPPTPQEVNGHGSALQDDATKRHGDLPVGVTPIVYPMADAAGNLMAEECRFTAEVKQKAHPVVIACPNDVTVQTLQSSMFGVPTWPPPSATQGGEPLGEEHISYPQGVRSGLPFPYGTTTVTAEARGRVTGERTGEAEQFDFCTFRVTVRDPFRPHVDGRHFRCAEPAGDAGAVEPYGICAGTDLRPAFHDGYEVTGGYDVLGVEKLEALPCCADQHGTAYTCAGGEFPGFTYCVPQAALAQKPVLALDVARSVADSGQADAWVLAGQRVCLPAESMKAIAVAARGGLAACQAAARADPDCTDAVVYGGPQRCLCSRTACDETQEQPDVDLYRLPKGLTLPQRQRSRWAFRGNAHCAPLGKELGKPAGSLEACKAAALADADCTGVIAYSRTNLMQCLCSTDACAAPKPHPDYEMYQRVGEP